MIIQMDDIVSIESARLFCLKQEAKIGITTGSFDLFNYYHSFFLKRCAKHCDILMIGVYSDELLKEFNKKTIFYNEMHRLELAEQSRYVDLCFLMNSNEDLVKVLEMFKPSWFFKKEAIQEQYEIPIYVIPNVEEMSYMKALNKIVGEK